MFNLPPISNLNERARQFRRAGLLGASVGDFAILPLLNARDLVALARASAACRAAANGADSARPRGAPTAPRPRGAPPPRFRNLRCLSQEHKPCNIL